MTGPQYPHPHGQPQPMPSRQAMPATTRNAVVIGLIVLAVSILVMVFSWLLVGIAILLVGALYTFLVFRGMPPMADVGQTMQSIQSLSGGRRPSLYYGVGHPGPTPTGHHTWPVQASSPVVPTPRAAGFTEAMAADPSTPAEVLNRIAAEAPHLRPALARNPATYDDLLGWLRSLGDPAVDAALAQRPRP